ncbi:hypothetical protein TBR22_A02600 [Luteitalea sp. TBR-22]|uniref:DUF2157 domain-containing protein n=1 Tax=Luteitalea sp. TBR-22 TaxID=2802971 RepID=UPI001AF53D82|nr:DUF2157 domain-containing protein [Luteitalea sp. TBR-22]BCS31060.1 hypothetical protein TBR22_A02600 [Luteitalea sp. TBR-22]
MTSSVPDPLGRAATVARLERVIDAIPVPDPHRGPLIALATRTPDLDEWRRFLASALLLLGAGLALSGVVSFFAFNWAALGRFAKMGLIAAATTAAAGGALRRPETLLSRVLLLAASVLTGALLAVYGQTYQTGADPWGLFGVWALLILPWTVAAAFTPLWLLWLALVDLAYALYVSQVLASPTWALSLLLGLLAMHVLALMAWELQHLQARPWLTDTWAPRMVAAATVLPLLVPAFVRVLHPGDADTLGAAALGAVSFLVVAFGVYHTAIRRDTFMLTLAAGAVMTIVTTAVSRLLMETLDLGLLGLMLITAFIVGEVTLVVSWLRRQSRGEAA